LSEQDNDTPAKSAKYWNLNNPAVFFATGFGVGLLPLAPGTWGSILAVIMAWWVVNIFGQLTLLIGTILCFCIGIWVSDLCIKHFSCSDPKQVVIDEIAAQWLVLLIVPLDLLSYFLKPWPISWADRSIKGGFGIMVDDILAAIYAMILIYGVTIWTGS
jgi:phosphatidylglycerophosphatase A